MIKTTVIAMFRPINNCLGLLVVFLTLLLLVQTEVSHSNPGSLNQTINDGSVSVQIGLNPLLTEAQTISLATLGINTTTGRGTRLFEIIIENNTDETITDLFLRMEVSSSRYGVIAIVKTNELWPFFLLPGQVAIATNNNLGPGVPGLTGTSFVGELTDRGEDLLSDLAGSFVLPDDIYSFNVRIFQGGNSPDNGRLLASASDRLGDRPIENVVDFMLLQPGNTIGSGEPASGQFPVFRWEGPRQAYRIVVVEERERQTPESLLQGAFSTESTLGPGASGSRLLDYEMLDALVTGTSFSYPISGARQLQEGRRYFWQVFALIPSTSGVQQRPSGIFEFTVPSTGQTAQAVTPTAEESSNLFAGLSQEIIDRLASLIDRGFQLESLEIDGITYTGPQLLVILQQFSNELQEGKIKLVNQ
jgi:hypothetical protein